MFRAFFVAFWGFEAGIIWIASDGTIKFITAAVGLNIRRDHAALSNA